MSSAAIAPEPAPRPALVLDRVTRRFSDVYAIREASLTVEEGDIVCLVGHSGCGKSTLLRIIAGVEHADTGRILLGDVELSGPGRFVEPEDRRIGLMFQDYALFPHLSVADNIAFGLKGMRRAEAARRRDETIALLGIEHLARRFPHMLSGGEQQRVALARALAPQPAVLLMDEPFSNLDPSLREKVRDDTLAMLRRLGTTVIVVTHDPEEALSLGDRIVLMKSGEIVQSGTGYEIYDSPATPYAAEFFCSYNKIVGRVTADGLLDTPLGQFLLPAPLRTAGTATAYLRPQDVRLDAAGGGAPATVVRKALLGEIEQVWLRVPGLVGELRVRSSSRTRFRAGDEVFVELNRENLLTFG